MISWYAFSTVGDDELSLLLKEPRFKKFFQLIDKLHSDCHSTGVDFPSNWLITSIDRYAKDGTLRYDIERGNHHNSKAIDIVPLNENLLLSLPISLNRNLFLMDLFTLMYNDDFGSVDLPILAFEADHLHLDVMHRKQIVRLRKVKPYFERNLYDATNTTESILKRSLDDGKLIRVNSFLSLF